MPKRTLLLLAVLSGCDGLWQGFKQPVSENCVIHPSACTQGQVCNTSTEVCEPEVSAPLDMSSSAVPLRAQRLLLGQPTAKRQHAAQHFPCVSPERLCGRRPRQHLAARSGGLASVCEPDTQRPVWGRSHVRYVCAGGRSGGHRAAL